MVRRKFATMQRGCATITKIEIHGFEKPFIFNQHQPFQEWRNRMKQVRPKAGELRILAQKLFGQKEGKENDWVRFCPILRGMNECDTKKG
jgi:hypothetical protein